MLPLVCGRCIFHPISTSWSYWVVKKLFVLRILLLASMGVKPPSKSRRR